MKKDFFLSRREGLALAMKQLYHYQTWATISLDQSEFEENALLEYFDADFDDPQKKDYEKVIAAAINRTVYEKNYIPKNMKRTVSIQATRDMLECLEVAAIQYHKEVKGMSEREAQNRLVGNRMIKRVAIVDNAVKWGVRRAARAGISFGIGALVTALCATVTVPAWVIGLATYAVISLLPDNIKKPIREGVQKAVDMVARGARNLAQALSQKAVKVAEKAKEVVEKVTNVAIKAWDETKILANKVKEQLKSIRR